MTYRRALFVGVTIGLINLVAAMIAAPIHGDAPFIHPLLDTTLIITFPVGMLCAWLLPRSRYNINRGGSPHVSAPRHS